MWIFRKVEWLNSTFYIQNIVSSDSKYICASHIHIDRFNYRRLVNLKQINEHSLITNHKCMWNLVPVDDSKSFYTIWNVYYDEPLYAASYLYKTTKSNSRTVFLWYSAPDSNQFNWEVNCD